MIFLSALIAILLTGNAAAQSSIEIPANPLLGSILDSILSNLHEPKDFRKNKTSGTVQIEFVIGKNGSPTQFKVLKEFLGASSNVKEALMRVRPDDF